MKLARPLQRPGLADGFWGRSPAGPRAALALAGPSASPVVCGEQPRSGGARAALGTWTSSAKVLQCEAKHRVALAYSLALTTRRRTGWKHKYLCGERPVLVTL